MELSYAIFVGLMVAGLAFQAGMRMQAFPSEEEMIRRIVQSRIERRLQEKIEAELADELNRRAAT